jgi:hypothetical protein
MLNNFLIESHRNGRNNAYVHGTSLILTVVADHMSQARSLISFIKIIIIRMQFKSNETNGQIEK